MLAIKKLLLFSWSVSCQSCGMDNRELTDTQRIWQTHVEVCAMGGGSMKAYAEEHGLDLQRF